MGPLFLYPIEARRLLYSTDAIESLHRRLRKPLRVRGHFPNDESVSKLVYLALRNAVVRFGPSPHWRSAMSHIRVIFGDRVPMAEA